MTTDPRASFHAQGYSTPPMTVLLTVLLLIFFFIGIFSVFFCRCFIHQARSNQQPPAPASPRNPPGLERKLMDSFPTFTYAAVKDLRIEKFGLECAICICEFVDDDVLRLLNKCCHVFHHDCIDLWLESNKTCPVCRRNLEIDVQQPVPMCGINEDELLHEIDIRNSVGDRMGGDRGAARVERTEMSDKFPRSHSTGHSIKKRKELENERYTLRLPEHLHARLFRGHKSTGSCTSFGEFTASTSTSNGGFGEISDFAGGDVNRVQQAMHIAN